ncbi:MAG: FtsX-like permease family protein, partial [Gemmatimonadota bacterium]|nr:FtsX-like permease family protein [Gemmatimonadota bacterium]
AIDSFADNVTGSIREQSRTLLGGDLALETRAAFPVGVDSLLDSLTNIGIKTARVTTLASMALADGDGGTRLVQMRAVSPGYPFYGSIETQPAAAWPRLQNEPVVLVDESLLTALDTRVGDSLKLGDRKFLIAGILGNVPGDAAITSVIGPRVYVADKWLAATGLLRFGSRADYSVLLRLPPARAGTREAATLATTLRRRLDPRSAEREEREARQGQPSRAQSQADDAEEDSLLKAAVKAADSSQFTKTPVARIRVRTVQETERDLTNTVSRLANFLSIIGLVALLLGGIGVASGINAFVAAKIDTVAMLRCLGATSRQVLALYVIQAAVMGLVGATAGAALGVLVQYGFPRVVGDFLPLDVHVAIEMRPLLIGLATGVWVSLVFAMRPLLALRRISPLQALRRNTDSAAVPRQWNDPQRVAVDMLLVSSIVAITAVRMGNVRQGLWVSAAIGAAGVVLYAAASLLIALAKRIVRPSWGFALRQGIANLHRPANQTRAVTLALGFGAFLLTTVFLVQSNQLRRIALTESTAPGNLLFYDVQDNQAGPLDSLIRSKGITGTQQTPIVTMRIQNINGRSPQQLQADTATRRAGWSIRREYRSTYRDTLIASEKLAAGAWFSDSATRAAVRRANPSAPFAISMEAGLAKDMGVTLNDTITWNVQGVEVQSVLTSLRTVNWARFEPNFFVVFDPAALQHAPQQFVFVASVPSATTLATIQRDAVRAFPNVSSLDLTLVRNTIGKIVSRVTLAVRFLGAFALLMGIPVLFSAVAATRRARIREGVLLRTLGASRAQVARILLAEYGALGLLGALTGMLLAFVGAWALTHFVFKDTFNAALIPTFAIAAGMLLLTMLIGFLTSRDVYRETPMAAIRES